MNKPLDVLLLTQDDATHSQQRSDLEHLGFQVHHYTDLAGLYAHVSQYSVPLIVLTGTLSRVHIATAQLRAMRPALGIIVMAAFADADARVRTLLCGADACLDINTGSMELAAVFQSLMRRGSTEMTAEAMADTAPTPKMVPAEGCVAVEPAALVEPTAAASCWRLASKGWMLITPTGLELPLTTAERSFVLRLVRAHDKKISREALITDGLHSGEASDSERRGRFVDVMLSRMRRKATANHMQLPIKAVHGWGYMLTVDVMEDAGSLEDSGAAST